MSRRFAKRSSTGIDAVAVLRLERSGGCVDRDRKYMQQMRQSQVREYFFGTSTNPLSPHMQLLDFSETSIYKAKDSTILFHYFGLADIGRFGYA